ncbi:MAG: hypothetical protein GEU78_19300 [Actinobacteria bacterium]|nr:hypothetical protein [Actinomycetota bacterium]
MLLKRCIRCAAEKPRSEFNKGAKRAKDGLHSYCRKCQSVYAATPDKRDKRRACTARWRAADVERARRLERAATKKPSRRAAIRAKAALRRAQKLQATPTWADHDKIKEIYRTCPEGYHVDHIVPLMGENVCGLHVHNNLQHLPAAANIKKGNRYGVLGEGLFQR